MNVRINNGFTLIELMVTLAVIAIVATIAVPVMSDMITRSRTTATFNELQGLISYARSESAKTPGNSILLCASANGTGCTGQQNWNVGWLIARDINGNSSVDVGDTVLKVISPLASGLSLEVKSAASATFATSALSLTRNGAPAGGNQATFKLCDAFGASEARGVIMTVSGQVRSAAKVAGGVRKDHNGIDFGC
jgi:type IV fimbrial biogenesis protein FimT